MKKSLTIVLAAGGTGGHIFPAKALAECLKAHGHTPILITDKRSANYGKFGDMLVDIIPAAGAGKGVVSRLLNAIKIVLGMMKASYYLHMASPDVVVGFGGYPSFPTMMAAVKRGYKTVIHEQNAVLGRVNRHFAPQVNAIATSFDVVQKINESDQHKVTVTGNPVRGEIVAIEELPYPDGNYIHILVTGGSQGASVLAKIVPEALIALPEALRARLVVDQQCRKADLAWVTQQYRQAGISAEVTPFFEDMPKRLAQAHVLICRAGASTLAEITVAGRPALLIPYPHAMDGHQSVNAHALEATGGAWVIEEKDFTPESLTKQLQPLLEAPERLRQAASGIKHAGHKDAAERLMALVEKVARGVSVSLKR